VTIPLAVYSFTIMNESRTEPSARKRYARVLLGILREQPGMFSILLMQFSRFAFKFVLLAYLPILLVNDLDASVGHVGLVISLAAVATVVTTTLVPKLIQRVPSSSAVMAGLLSIATAIASFSVIPNWPWAFGGAVLYGIGDGILAVFSDAYAMHSARSGLSAGMVSVSQTARNLGKLSSPVAMAAIAAVSSLPVAFVAMAVAGALIAPLMLPLRRMDHELHSSEPEPTTEVVSGAGESLSES
jgi:MFS family permease